MTINTIHVDAPSASVFDDVLLDAASYGVWVVGSKRIRGVDPTWPAVGSSFHHTVGWGPFEDHDVSQVLELDPPHRIVLEARVWPMGTAKVSLDLEPEGDGTRVTMVEELLRGPAKKLDTRLVHLLLKGRNAIAVRRLKAWAEQRHHAKPGVPPEPPD